MSGLLGTLLNNGQALNVQSRALEITGKNLANINNPAYARQRVQIGSMGTIDTALGNQSMGVAALGLQQMRDALLDRQMQRESGLTASLEARQLSLQATESAMGQQFSRLDDAASVSAADGSMGSGLNETLSSFFNAFESWSVRPSDPAEKQLLLQKSDLLIEKINTTNSRLTQVQTDITAQVTVDVATANDLMTSIADLNTAIGRAEIGKPESAVDLRDQRQEKIEKLAAFFSFEVQSIPNSNGQVSLTAKDGLGNNVSLVNPKVTGALTFDGTNFSGGAPATVLALSTGSLSTRINVRDGMVADLRTSLKNLADQLTTSVNAAYNPTATAGMNFFSAVPATGLIATEASLATLRASATVDPGANELAVAVAALSGKIFSTGGGDLIDSTFSAHYSAMVSTLGLDLSSTNARLADQLLSEQVTASSRDAVSGVSQDEEMTDLLRFQRSFQATARFSNAVDELLDIVVNRLGKF